VTAPPPTDAALLRATAAGDEEAFLEIYRRYQDRVFRFACRMTGSREAAEDVTHNCFASLLERPRGFEPGRSGLGTYLCAAARNQSLTHARRTWREAAGLSGPDLRPAREPGPLDLVLAHERGRMVREALLRLAPLHREVVILADYDELDLAAIAEIVGAEVGAVKVRLHRARRKLRRALEGYMGGAAVAVAPGRV
jgi:RNA polymerase sigma-70 factor, ECF subfamily